MGNLINPNLLRLNNNILWKSNWVSYQHQNYSYLLSHDYFLKSYINWVLKDNYFVKLGWVLYFSHYKVLRYNNKFIVILFFKDYNIKKFFFNFLKKFEKKKFKNFYQNRNNKYNKFNTKKVFNKNKNFNNKFNNKQNFNNKKNFFNNKFNNKFNNNNTFNKNTYHNNNKHNSDIKYKFNKKGLFNYRDSAIKKGLITDTQKKVDNNFILNNKVLNKKNNTQKNVDIKKSIGLKKYLKIKKKILSTTKFSYSRLSSRKNNLVNINKLAAIAKKKKLNKLIDKKNNLNSKAIIVTTPKKIGIRRKVAKKIVLKKPTLKKVTKKILLNKKIRFKKKPILSKKLKLKKLKLKKLKLKKLRLKKNIKFLNRKFIFNFRKDKNKFRSIRKYLKTPFSFSNKGLSFFRTNIALNFDRYLFTGGRALPYYRAVARCRKYRVNNLGRRKLIWHLRQFNRKYKLIDYFLLPTTKSKVIFHKTKHIRTKFLIYYNTRLYYYLGYKRYKKFVFSRYKLIGLNLRKNILMNEYYILNYISKIMVSKNIKLNFLNTYLTLKPKKYRYKHNVYGKFLKLNDINNLIYKIKFYNFLIKNMIKYIFLLYKKIYFKFSGLLKVSYLNNCSVYIYLLNNNYMTASLVTDYIGRNLKTGHNLNKIVFPLLRYLYDKNKHVYLGWKIGGFGRFQRRGRARKQWFLKGRVPVSTLIRNVDYNSRAVQLRNGICNLKVFIIRRKRFYYNI